MDVAKALRNVTNKFLCAQTVRNSLKAAGLKALVKKKKPFLSKRHRKARMDFALAHQHWTVEDWKKVVWSDETKINRLGSDGRKWVWKKAGVMAVVKRKRPLLTKKHMKERLDFAIAHQDWTLEDWKKVVWSDETKINHLGSDGRKWVWKKPGEGLSKRLVKGTVKFGEDL